MYFADESERSAGRRRAFGVGELLALQEFGDGGGAGADLEFFVDAMEVGADGEGADVKFFSNFGVAQPAAQVFEDFEFARAEGVDFGLRPAATLEGFNNEAGDGARHGRTTGADFEDGIENFDG